MAFPIEKKLVVGISSRALFDLEEENRIFDEQGVEAYTAYQEENKDVTLEKGIAFPFVRRLLNLNQVYPDEQPVEVVLLSRNSPSTGIRVFSSIQKYGLNITRAAFMSGGSPYSYIPAFNISLFLSNNLEDVQQAIDHSFPAGLILDSKVEDDPTDMELRVAFDFDGVLADDSAEKIYQEQGIEAYREHEKKHSASPLTPGLVANFFRRLADVQQLENARKAKDSGYKKSLKISVVTARNAPAHERAINTLRGWDVSVDEMFLLGGIEKKRILDVLKPHLFIDDQRTHLDSSTDNVALVHIPFGITNKRATQ
jgi:5'-nucleotidase